MITQAILEKIRQIVRYFETSKISGSDYGALSMYHDGPDKRIQITYGATQTTEFGLLGTLIKMYVDSNGKYSADFRTFLGRIGDLSKPSLVEVPTFIQLLKDSANDPVMQQTQNRFFNIYYLNPARQWFEKNGFTLPLSLLVIYDSYVHSGSILTFLRNSFPEKVPAAGGDEKEWISLYVQTRDHWLETNKTPLLQATDYRTDSFIYAIRQNNWDLSLPFSIVNYKTAEETDKPIVQAVVS